MRFLGFGSKKIVTDSERKIIANAIEQAEKCSFENLYMRRDSVIDYQKLGSRTELEAAQELAVVRIATFIKNNNAIGYVIKNANKWYNKLDEKEDTHIKEALGTLIRIDDMIVNKRYKIIKMGVLYYPEVICYEDEKKTREQLLMLLRPLPTLK